MRAKGYYWVRYNDFEWELAHWKDGTWILSGLDGLYRDGDMAEIDERPVSRQAELASN